MSDNDENVSNNTYQNKNNNMNNKNPNNDNNLVVHFNHVSFLFHPLNLYTFLIMNCIYCYLNSYNYSIGREIESDSVELFKSLPGGI